MTLLQARMANSNQTVVGTSLLQPRMGDSSAFGFRSAGYQPRPHIEVESDLVRLISPQGGRDSWNGELVCVTHAPVQKGHVCLVMFEMRCAESFAETGEGTALVYFQKASPPWKKSVAMRVRAGHEWRGLLIPFVCNADYAQGQAELGIAFADIRQTLEVRNIRVINFKNTRALEDMPRTQVRYPLHGTETPWYREAQERINQHRKAEMNIIVMDRQGNPVPGVELDITMTRHAFGFGTAVDLQFLMDPDARLDPYRRQLLRCFNRVVTENDLKWPQWIGESGDYQRETTMHGLQWLKNNQFTVAGHVLVWPGWKWLPKLLQQHQDNPIALRKLTLAHMEDILTATRHLTQEWDVLNEPFAHHDLIDLLGPQAMVEWFIHARQHHPAAKLRINDFGILASGGGRTDTVHQQHYEDTIRYLLKNGAPLDAIGMQGHFGEDVTPPATLWKILDRYTHFGLPIQVTEFDVNTTDESFQADYTHDFMTALFAHPATEALVMWGFWEGRHWFPDAAMFRKDWSLKPNGLVYQDLVLNQWWTRLRGRTDRFGRYTARGFKGDYVVTVRPEPGHTPSQSSPIATHQFTLKANGTKVQVKL